MCGSMFYTWGGAGKSWPKPNSVGQSIISANLRDRDYPIDYALSSRIQSGSAQNRADFASTHAGVESEAIKAYKQNFQS